MPQKQCTVCHMHDTSLAICAMGSSAQRSISLAAWPRVPHAPMPCVADMQAQCHVLLICKGLDYTSSFMQLDDSLVAKQHLHSLIGRYLTLVGEGDKSTQVVNLALNQSIHSPEDRVQVGQPYPTTNMGSGVACLRNNSQLAGCCSGCIDMVQSS